MPNIWIIRENELPAPRTGYDLVLWMAPRLPAEVQVRTWAGWSETPIIAWDASGAMLAFNAQPQEWKHTILAIGSGRVFKFQGHYIAWLVEADLRIPEIPRALAVAGVTLIISTTAHWTPVYLNPLWRAAQANQIWGMTVGEYPALFGPCELDPAEEGVMPLTSEGTLCSVSLDFNQLSEARRIFPVHQGLRANLYRTQKWWS
ncbi:MAG: hypothetical protein C7B45_02075 [Sulfobacillus acidophilus]|uniref:Uncharacterized protein n=1 Tax=Sulfobacillus acidophilus TaxID=53633 RepID=A0A2T2WNL3_9FIRM|nr:MAG: hypothetical protein C7B45_02075 [Sulfobacillus acidophilus]